MNVIKNVVALVLIAAILYGAYIILNKKPAVTPPEVMQQQEWLERQLNDSTGTGPDISLGAPDVSGMPLSGGSSDPSILESPGAPVAVDAATALGGGAFAAEPPSILPPTGELPSTDPIDLAMPGDPMPGDPMTGMPPQPPVPGPPAGESYPATQNPNETGLPTDPAGTDTARIRRSGPTVFESAWESADRMLAENRLAEALFTLTSWYRDPNLTPEEDQRLVQLLDQLAGTVLYSPDYVSGPAVLHEVARGETLESIAGKYNIPPEFIVNVNGIRSPEDLSPTRKIKVVQGPFRAEVNRGRQELTLFVGGYYAGRFPVGFGRDVPREDITLTVAEKMYGRTYYDPQTGAEIPPGDPNNPYGSTWIGLRGESPQVPGCAIGLHAVSPMEARESGEPRGSVILEPRSAADLSAILSIDSKVIFRR